MHISGRGKGIVDLNLSVIFASDEDKRALAVVRSLDISFNSIKELRALLCLTTLSKLNSSHNRLASIHNLPKTLTHVDVSHNALASLDGLLQLPLLQELDISHNKLTSLAGISRTSPLQVLKVTNNRLISLEGVETAALLKILLVDYNLISTTDSLRCLKPLHRIEALSLRGCPVTQINDYRLFARKVVP